MDQLIIIAAAAALAIVVAAAIVWLRFSSFTRRVDRRGARRQSYQQSWGDMLKRAELRTREEESRRRH